MIQRIFNAYNMQERNTEMISIDKTSDKSLYEQLYEQMKSEILNEHYAAGEKLPATRQLAAEHKLSRNTVVSAYNQLELEGYIRSVTGSGYYVENISAFSPDKKSRQSHNIQRSSRQSGKTFDYTFSYGNLDYNCYHSRAWRKCLTNAWDMISMADTASYQMSQGSYTLRSLITEYLYMSRGVNCTPEQIILTSGHQRSIDIITHIFSSSDYSFAMEDPGYNGTWEIVSQSPFRIIPIPLEDDGVSIEHIQRLRDTLLYVTPSHQFPMGSILPISKRLELIEWAVQSGSYIIEDDYDSELRYQSRPIPSLQSIDNSGRTIYLGTFSKSMSPDLRISYMVLPENLMKDYSSRYSHTNCTVPTVLQLALIEFIQSGNYQRHIGAMKNHYKKKHDYILNYVKQNLEDDVIMYGAGAGLHFVAEIKNSYLTQSELISAFEQKGIRIFSTEPFWIRKNLCPENQLLFGFSAIPYEKLPGAMKTFSKIIHSL